MPHQVTCTVCKNSYPTTLAFGQARCIHCGHMNNVISPAFANSSTRIGDSYSITVNEDNTFVDLAVTAVVDVVSATVDAVSDTFSGGGGDFGGGGSSDSW